MKLKSLLLGSAAALVAFTGARAADAVIAEPEPMEYVRVCDAYGAGYFYIPGTETCLKIGGFVRYQIDVSDASNTWGKKTQANVSFSAKSDTEWGTLEGFVEFTSDVTNSDVTGIYTASALGIDSAYISLGGLKMGYFDNAFDGGIVGENDDLGGSKTNSISYTFASGGFDATISLDEKEIDENAPLTPLVVDGVDFIPNVSANVGFSAGAVAVRLFGAYDEEVSEGAVKLRVGADVTEGGRFEVAAVYATGSNYSWSASEWSVAAAYQQKFSDTITAALGVQYWSDRNFGGAGSPDRWQVGANVDWTPVTNFLVRAQVGYFDDELTNSDGFAGRLRFQRSF
jgi:hypothetical protein